MTVLRTLCVLSVFLLGGAVVVWIALVVRMRRHCPAAPKMGSVVPMFLQGAAIIRWCPWLLILPVLAVALGFVVSLPELFALLKSGSSLHPSVIVWGGNQGFLAGPFPFSVLVSLASGIGSLATAMIVPFESPLVVGTCLLIATVALLQGHPAALSVVGVNQERRFRLGLAFGVAGLAFLLVHYRMQTLGAEDVTGSVWLRYLLSLLTLPAEVFVFGALLSLMDAGAAGTRLPPAEATFQALVHFKALFLFLLAIFGIGLVVSLPLLALFGLGLGPRSEAGQSVSLVLFLNTGLAAIVGGLISFVPALAVTGRHSFSEAVRECLGLWARRPKNAGAFVLAGALLLGLPRISELSLRAFLHFEEAAGHILLFLVGLTEVALGVLVMSSMVAFCRKDRELG